MCPVEMIQNVPEGIAQADAFLRVERSNCVQHMIDRIVLRQVFFTLRGHEEHDRAFVLVRRLSDQVRFLLEGLHDLRRRGPGSADEAGQRGWSPRKSVGAPEKPQRHPFSITQPMLIAFEIPCSRRLNQQLDCFACQWHDLRRPSNLVYGVPKALSTKARGYFLLSQTAGDV